MPALQCKAHVYR